ncbi:unnamed protein product [Ceutorhynchus assimilis]|uniref:Uncharacterized protein n=1 Tax=Ceutorhynchus assimilis TaxID=467358 RepID=A0A9N9MMZ6_9CUCU|nr:unnamed protein product [Ceutorhynchus assimilis]
MSSFFSNLFGGKKAKKEKSTKEITVKSIKKTEDTHEDDNNDKIPVLNRRLSLSKSGRMKEKKRINISVLNTGNDTTGDFAAGNDKNLDRKNSLPTSDVFDIEGIERAEKEHCSPISETPHTSL